MKTIINNSKKNSNKTKIIIISMVLLFCSVSKNIYSQLLQYGKSVVTSFDYADLNYNVVRILDIRNRPPFIPGGSQWNPPQAFGANWTKQRMGDVFGITLDNMSPPNIFVSSSSAYCEEPYNLAGLIYRIDGVTGVVTNYINRSNIAGPPLTGNNIMCNTGPDLGNLCFDKKHQQIFATNHEDGIIYRIKDNGSGVGTVQDYYDPFVSDNSTNGFAPRGERLWGIGTFGTNISNVRVYFSRWNSDISMEQSYIQNEIWSIALTASGNFTGVPRLEISLPLLPVFKVSNPVSDIEFTSEGDMLLGERSMFGDMGDCQGGGVFAHTARILEFTRQTNGLYNDYSYMVVKIGEYFDGYNNSSGGVDYSYGQYDPINNVNSLCNNMIAGTGDALLYNKTANFYIYGVQTTFRPKAGAVNSKDYSHYIDLNGNTNQTDKTTPGDIDVYRIDSCNSSHGVLDSNGGSGIGSNNNIDTCKYYFANSQAPPGIYPSRPLNYWNYETANRMKLIQNGVNMAGAKLFGGMDDGYFRLRLKDIQALSGSDTNKKLKLCGTCYDSIFISTNGIIGFTEHPSPGIPNQNWLDWPGNYVNSFQYGNYDRAAIYPFWLDFDFSKPDSTGGINGISCEVINNQLQIYYSRAKLFNVQEYVSFEVCYELTECSSLSPNIKFTYSDATLGRTSPGFITRYKNSNGSTGLNIGPYLVGIAPKFLYNDPYILYRKTDFYGYMTNTGTIHEPRINRPLFANNNTGLTVEFGINASQLGKCNCRGNGLIYLNSKMFLEGFYDSGYNLQVRDSVRFYLRSVYAPYNIIDSAISVVSDSGNASVSFPNAVSGTYFIVVKHRNSIETWSSTGVLMTQGITTEYDFTNANTKAFGNNLKQVDMSPIRFAVYSGDVNQDGIVDASDVAIVDNDAYNFIYGYVNSDLNGDDFVDASDLALVENNSAIGVSAITP